MACSIRIFVCIIFLTFCLSLLTVQPVWAQGSAFTYQGTLNNNNVPGNGNFDFEFKLFDLLNTGIQQGATVQRLNVPVTNGSFTVTLDFGAAVFSGAPRFLEISVRAAGGGAFTVLTPRQQITATPYSIKAVSASAADGLSAACVGCVTSTQIQGGGAYINNTTTQQAGANFNIGGNGTVGGNLITNGNVGIGTSTPGYKLDVAGNLRAAGSSSNDVQVETAGGTNAWARFNMKTTNQIWTLGTSQNFNGDQFYLYDFTHGQRRLTVQPNGGTISFPSNNSNDVQVETAGGTNAWARFNMKTTNQTWSLGTSQNFNGDQFYLYDFTFGQRRMTVQPNGGTVSFPNNDSNDVQVETAGGTNAWARFNMKTPNQTWTLGTSRDFNGDQFYLYDFTNNQFVMTAQPRGGAVSFPNANVGVGTFNPITKLHIEDNPITEMTIRSRAERAILSLDSNLGGQQRVWTLESGIFGQAGRFGIYDRTAQRERLGIGPDGVVGIDVLQIRGGADFSENFDVNAAPINEDETSVSIEPGMVVSIDPANPGKLLLSSQAYDRRVAGIISGAGGVRPGMMMSQEGTLAHGSHPVALSGRVYCLVDASQGAIEPGDLLTTSNLPGYAMKVADPAKAQGAIIGKAMTPLSKGKGLVLVLVSLQ